MYEKISYIYISLFGINYNFLFKMDYVLKYNLAYDMFTTKRESEDYSVHRQCINIRGHWHKIYTEMLYTVCGATSKDFENLNETRDSLKFSLSILQARIRLTAYCLQTWHTRFASVDFPKAGFENANHVLRWYRIN